MRKKICEFRARNSIKNERSYKYNSINEAIDDISNMFGDWIDFKLLV